MPKTQRLIVACLALATGVGLGFLFATVFTFDVADVPPPAPMVITSDKKQQEIQQALKQTLVEIGVTTDGLSPYVLLEHFDRIEEQDFNGVEAIIGQYEVANGALTYKSGEQVSDAAAADISDAGFTLFLRNYANRTGIDISASSTAEIVAHLRGDSVTSSNDIATSSDSYTACTMDAKVCPDGSYVGRTGPSCEFAACPSEVAPPKEIVCTPEQKQAEACIEIYQPVCASVQIQCITTPCEPIPKTFPNSCYACSEQSVTEYTEGACATQ